MLRGKLLQKRNRLILLTLLLIFALLVNIALPFITNFDKGKQRAYAIARDAEKSALNYAKKRAEHLGLPSDYYRTLTTRPPIKVSVNRALIYIEGESRAGAVDDLFLCLRRDWIGNWFAGEYNLIAHHFFISTDEEARQKYRKSLELQYEWADKEGIKQALSESDCAI